MLGFLRGLFEATSILIALALICVLDAADALRRRVRRRRVTARVDWDAELRDLVP